MGVGWAPQHGQSWSEWPWIVLTLAAPHQAADLLLPGADRWVSGHRVVRWNFQRRDGTNPRHHIFSSDPRTIRDVVAAFEMAWDRAAPHAEYKARPILHVGGGLAGGVRKGAVSDHPNVMLRCETQELAGTLVVFRRDAAEPGGELHNRTTSHSRHHRNPKHHFAYAVLNDTGA